MPSGECCRFRSWDLCINVNHIAELREAGGEAENDPVQVAVLCEKAGCDGIKVHLREDGRYIQEKDVFALKDVIRGKFNLEIGLSGEIINIAKKVKPAQITIVPEKTEEITKGGGFDVRQYALKIKDTVKLFHGQNIAVSLLVEPDIETIELSKDCGVDFVELHAGKYRSATDKAEIDREIKRICDSSFRAMKAGIKVSAGHGLNYKNIIPVLFARGLEEVHIGRSIFSRSVAVGLPQAVDEMLDMLY